LVGIGDMHDNRVGKERKDSRRNGDRWMVVFCESHKEMTQRCQGSRKERTPKIRGETNDLKDQKETKKTVISYRHRGPNSDSRTAIVQEGRKSRNPHSGKKLIKASPEQGTVDRQGILTREGGQATPYKHNKDGCQLKGNDRDRKKKNSP